MYATADRYLGMYQLQNSHLKKEAYVPHVSHTREEEKNTEMYSQAVLNTSDPKVWGPPMWSTFHVSAAHYPLQASPLVKERMKNRILAIPYEVSCQSCRVHASAFVEENREDLDRIVSGRHELGKFYVRFHNYVNRRQGKPEWTYEQAYKKYAGTTQVNHLE